MKMLLPALAVLSSTAMAADYKINVDSRIDYSNSKTTNEAGTAAATTSKTAGFSTALVRANLVAKLSDELSFRFRYRFNGLPAVTDRDSSTDKLDYAYIDHKNSLFMTRFGKQKWDDALGRESYVSAADFYVSSKIKKNFGDAVGEYRMGGSAMFKFMDTHNLTAAISNPNPNKIDTSTTDTKNVGLAYGVYYNSSLLNKMIQPTLGYTSATQDAQQTGATKTKKVNYTLWAAGLRSEVAGFIVDVDYKELKLPERNGAGTLTKAEETTKSIYSNVAYTINEWTPFVAYVNDKYKDNDSSTSNYKRTALALGVQYKPYADFNFRYHLAYTSDVTKYDSGVLATNSKVKTNTVLFGIKTDI